MSLRALTRWGAKKSVLLIVYTEIRIGTLRERERDRDRQTDRQTDRQRQTETDRQTETQTDRQTETQSDRQRDTQREMSFLIPTPEGPKPQTTNSVSRFGRAVRR